MKKGKLILCTALILAIMVSLCACVRPRVSPEPLLKDFDMLKSAISIIASEYMNGLDVDKADYLAASAIINGLDPYTFLKDYDIAVQDSAVLGMGVITTRFNEHYVDYIVDDGPMDVVHDGFHIQRGDEIFAVGGKRVRGLSNSYLADYIAGEDGTEVVLTMYRDGEMMGDYTYTKRDMIIPRAFYQADIAGAGSNVGYIRLTAFSSVKDAEGTIFSASKDFERCMNAFKADGMQALVLDLRGNGGGNTEILADIASYFVPLKEGGKARPIIELDFAKSDNIQQTRVTKDNYIPDLPLFILCNSGTASASECLIGACKAWNPNVTVIGTPTHGKGVFQQSAVPIADKTEFNSATFPDQYYIVLVSGYFYIYDDNVEGGKYCIHEDPIEPTITVEASDTVGALADDPEVAKAIVLAKNALHD